MDRNNRSDTGGHGGGLTRRDVLAATAAAGAAATAGALVATPALADAAVAADFGAPVVELSVPYGVLSLEQRGALIKGITDVVLGALHRQPDPARKLFMQIVETAEGGFGINGQVFAPRAK